MSRDVARLADGDCFGRTVFLESWAVPPPDWKRGMATGEYQTTGHVTERYTGRCNGTLDSGVSVEVRVN